MKNNGRLGANRFLRLIVLSAFFHFSGIHNGYSIVQASLPSVSGSVQSVCGLVHSFASLANPVVISSPFNGLQEWVVRVTLKAGGKFLSIFASPLALIASSFPSYISSQSGTSLPQLMKGLSLLEKQETYNKLKKESWNQPSDHPDEFLTGAVERRTALSILLAEAQGWFAHPLETQVRVERAFRQSARSDCGEGPASQNLNRSLMELIFTPFPG